MWPCTTTAYPYTRDVRHSVCGMTCLFPFNLMKIHENQLALHFIMVVLCQSIKLQIYNVKSIPKDLIIF